MNEKVFISSWVSKITSRGIKNFPSDFLSVVGNFSEVRLPGKTLLIGEEFFGQYEIITPDGSPVFHAGNYMHAKFILYSNRNTPEIILVPSDETHLKKAVQEYESYLDSIIKEIESSYKRSLPDERNSKAIVNEIFKQLNLVRV